MSLLGHRIKSHQKRSCFHLPLSGMRYRKLRIAWLLLCCSACALLVAIWLRSYWRELDFAAPVGTANGIYAEVNTGEIFITFGPTLKNYGWYVSEVTQAAIRLTICFAVSTCGRQNLIFLSKSRCGLQLLCRPYLRPSR